MIHQIITDIDDQDAYKFFMQYAVIKHYPNAIVEYEYILRDKKVKFPEYFDVEVARQVDMMADLKFKPNHIEHLAKKLPFFDSTYFKYLESYRYNPSELSISNDKGELKIKIRGYWHSTIFWEVPLLAIITELYYIMTNKKDLLSGEMKFNSLTNKKNIFGKIDQFKKYNFKIAEFGTRRRFSKENQEYIIGMMKTHCPECLIGTSNVMFSRKFNIRAIGTMAHEWPMFHAAKYGPEQANREMLGKWVETFHGNLGIALPDTFTSDVFLRSFDTFYSKLFDGIRHDSGDPVDFAKKIIEHYQKFKIILPDGLIPKTIVFSDNIHSLEQMIRIEKFCKSSILFTFGIGTWLTNDLFGFKPMNHVIKMTGATPEGMLSRKTIKLSDDKGKVTGEKSTAKIYKTLLNI